MLKVEMIAVQGTASVEDCLIDGPIAKEIRRLEKEIISNLKGNGALNGNRLSSLLRATIMPTPATCPKLKDSKLTMLMVKGVGR